MKEKIYILIIFLIIFIFFLPFFLNPSELTAKDNDLGRTYVPLFNFIHSSFYQYGQIPLWRSDQLMGETFVGNPLSALFYPGNLLFIILPVRNAIVIYIFTDLIIAAISTFILARSLKLSPLSSFAAAIFYAFSTKMLVHLEAGHITMLTAFAFFPLAVWSLRELFLKRNFKSLLVGSISLSFIYITYPTIFYYAAVFLIIYWAYLTAPKIIKNFSAGFLITFLAPLALMLITFFGLSALAIIPQLELGPLSTREALTLQDVAIPLWNLEKFQLSITFPYLSAEKLDHEAFLYFGTVPTLLFLYGFLKLTKSQQITIAAVGILTLLFVAGLSTPIFKWAYDFMPGLKYSRVTTRLWFAVTLVVVIVGAKSLENIKKKQLTYILLAVFLVESIFIFYKRYKTINPISAENKELYQYLSKDNNIFRVYCTTACFDTQLLSTYRIQTLEGESPIAQKDFVEFLSRAGNYKWDQFSVIFPPYQVWQTASPPVPNAPLLGGANVKYVASTYPIENSNLDPEKTFGKIFLYKNNKYLPRAYFLESSDMVKIIDYSPNKIKLNFNPSINPRTLIFSENYYPGWFAYIDRQKFNVEKYDIFRKIVVPVGAKDLELKFQPQSFSAGLTTALSTITFLVIYYFRKGKK